MNYKVRMVEKGRYLIVLWFCDPLICSDVTRYFIDTISYTYYYYLTFRMTPLVYSNNYKLQMAFLESLWKNKDYPCNQFTHLHFTFNCSQVKEITAIVPRGLTPIERKRHRKPFHKIPFLHKWKLRWWTFYSRGYREGSVSAGPRILLPRCCTLPDNELEDILDKKYRSNAGKTLTR